MTVAAAVRQAASLAEMIRADAHRSANKALIMDSADQLGDVLDTLNTDRTRSTGLSPRRPPPGAALLPQGRREARGVPQRYQRLGPVLVDISFWHGGADSAPVVGATKAPPQWTI